MAVNDYEIIFYGRDRALPYLYEIIFYSRDRALPYLYEIVF